MDPLNSFNNSLTRPAVNSLQAGDYHLDESFAKVVFDKRPLLGRLLQEDGVKSLAGYSYQTLFQRLAKPDLSRQAEFIETLQRLIGKRLGEKVALELAAQLQRYFFVSTADHHGPACPAFPLNSNLIATSGYAQINDPVLKYMVVLSCASVSLNNEDFPRGLFFHSLHDGKMELQRLSFLPSNSHASVVYHFRPYLKTEVEKMKKLLREKVRAGVVVQAQADLIFDLLEKIYARPDMFECENYCEQITKSNFELWRCYFGKDGIVLPDLVYLEQEEVVVQLLLDHHLQADTLINRMIFDLSYREKLINPLQQVMEQFLRQGVHGADLFWGISADKHYRLQLQLQGNELVSSDGSFKVALTPEALRKALELRTLMPSLLLIYTVLVLYYGLNCLGGFNQMHYLESMQRTYNALKLDSIVSRANTQLFNYGLQFLFLNNGQNTQIPAIGLDLLLYGPEDTWVKIQKDLQGITLAEAFNPSLAEIHGILCGKKE